MATRSKKTKSRKRKPTRRKKPAPRKKPARKSSKHRRAPSRTATLAAAETAATDSIREVHQLSADDVERRLLSRESPGVLEDYFGEAEYQELRRLAQRATQRTVRGGPRVLVLPGIMGSKLGSKNDLLWIDPIDVIRGKLTKLALNGSSKYGPQGVILLAYLKMKLRLKIAGFDADFYDFDWRKSIVDLGKELAAHVKTQSADSVSIVAHSMGGLVTRAALKHDTKLKLGRLVMLGTPNFGSFVPVEAFRATYDIVRKVGAIDLKNSPEELAEKVFKTFPGLHEMLPSPQRYTAVDLYDAASWPNDAPVPRQAMLDAAKRAQSELADADSRFYLIAGVNQETTTGVAVKNGTFEYEISREGDETVPLAFALLPGATTYYVEESHGSLPNNNLVASAVIDILRSGATSLLPDKYTPPPTRRRRTVRDEQLRVDPYGGRTYPELSQRERRELLEGLVSPYARDGGALADVGGLSEADLGDGGAGAPVTVDSGFAHSLKNVEVTRRRAHSVELCLAQGSITNASVRALVLGLFRDVDPDGAAAAVDQRLDGAIHEFSTRRMFSAEVGEVFAMPTGRHLIVAETVMFAGLGRFDTFGPEVQQFVAENVVRACARTNVEDFASVLLGTGSGWDVASVVANQLAGYFRGIKDSPHGGCVRRITLCEIDADRFREMKEAVYRLASTALFADFEVTFDETTLPDPVAQTGDGTRALAGEGAPPVYLIVSQEVIQHDPKKHKSIYGLRSSVLTAGAKAAIVTGTIKLSPDALSKHLAGIETKSFEFARLPKFGEELAELTLDPSVRQVLAKSKGCHLIVVHDAETSRVPWETLCIDGYFPAAAAGISRRYAAQNLSVAKWLEERRIDERLDILLVANPTEDLDGAEREAARLKTLFASNRAIEVTEVHGAEATKSRLLAELQSGKYDLVHYAGHAFFDADDWANSGILCAGEQVLSGSQLAGTKNLPALVFFNACESGRVRGVRARSDVRRRIDRNVGLAEAFLRGGIAAYVGTYWPVGDAAAKGFAEAFYTELVGGGTVGAAVDAGRKKVRASKSVDWADYVHYGPRDFRLKLG